MPDNPVLAAADSSTPQFAKAEYAAGPGSDTCRICGQTIVGAYYRINNAMGCASCAEQAARGQPQDSHVAYSRAVLFGIGGAVAGLILYAGFTIVTEIEVGYVALAVGWLVGKGLLTGSNGIGGRRYQVTAAILTYAAVSLAAVPIAIGIPMKHHQPLVQQQRTEAAADAGGAMGSGTQTPAAPEQSEKAGLARAVAMLVGYGLASPFLELRDPVHGIIGLVILVVGIRIAWRMTAARALVVDGPYSSTTAAV